MLLVQGGPHAGSKRSREEKKEKERERERQRSRCRERITRQHSCGIGYKEAICCVLCRMAAVDP